MARFRLADLIDDRPEDGVFQISRRMYTDPDLFEVEIKEIFERGWVFLGLSSQAPKSNDFFTTSIGRVPVFVSRDASGELRAFINACPHKGARITRRLAGNAKLHVCPYHGWTFDSAGENTNVRWDRSGGYTDAFRCTDHNLVPIARFGEYKGFLFGCLTPGAPSLEEYLGEARKALDLVADQSPEGLEVVPGRVRFTYAANWKMQMENCSDQYHFASTHLSLIRVLEMRARDKARGTVESAISNASYWKAGGEDVTGGSFSFEHGHVLTWGKMTPNPSLPLFERAEELAGLYGPLKRDWMFNMRNLTLFPNLQIAENASLQMRVIRPLAHNLTEMQTWCLAPWGESDAARMLRIRQYEDFFNPTGMATPDDNSLYEECEIGLAAQGGPWLQGLARGHALTIKGGNSYSDAIHMTPVSSVTGPAQLADETLLQNYYRAWAERMSAVLS